MPDLTNYEYDIFLSHNRADQELTAKLAERLEQEQWQGRQLRVFFSPWDIRPGQSIPREIEKALSKSRKVGLVMSPDAMSSAWVELERLVTTYIDVSVRDERLIPLYRSECQIPSLLRPILYIDFRDDIDFNGAYKTLLAVIKEEPLPRGAVKRLDTTASLLDIPRPPIVGFVSRSDRDGQIFTELLREELAPDKAQLIALWGAGGVGKTTLAAETARALADDFAQRVVWVSADGRSDLLFTTFLDEIATQLGDEELRKLAPERKSDAVRSLVATSRTLIVLDNFETIAAHEREQCLAFLAHHAQCSALITTRQKLEHVRSLPITGMLANEAQGFLQRLIAQTQDPAIFSTAYRQRLIDTAESNPLIMEWIVGQIDLANDPEEVLNDLALGEGDAAHRVFDRSYNLPQLNDGGRAVLLALSLFTPSAGRPMLAAVAGMDLAKERNKKRFKKAQETLASLWLITKMDRGLRLSVAGLIRELTRKRLARDNRVKAFSNRFVSRLVRYAKTHGNSAGEDYTALEFEKDNLRSAADAAVELGDWRSVLDLAGILAAPVNGMLKVRGYWDEGLQMGQLALKIARSQEMESSIGDWSYNVALMNKERGDYSRSRSLYKQALEIYTKQKNQRNIAVTLQQLGSLAHTEGDLEEAHRLYWESLEMAKELGPQLNSGIALQSLGSLAQDRGDFDEARRFLDQGLEIALREGAQLKIASVLHQLGWLEQEEGQLEEARGNYDEALGIFEKLGDQSGIARSLHHLGWLSQLTGDFQDAEKKYREALSISRKLGDHAGIASTLHQLGTVELARKNYDASDSLLRQSLDMLRKLTERQNCAECLESVGHLRMAQGRLLEAQSSYSEALQIAEELGIRLRIASIKRSLGLLAEKNNDRETALKLLRQALSAFEKVKSPQAEATRQVLVRVESKSG